MRTSEKLLQSWEGVQTVLNTKYKIQFMVVFFIGLVSTLCFSLLIYGKMPFSAIGVVFGIMYATLFVIMLDTIISRRRDAAKQRKKEEIIQLLHETLIKYGKNITSEVLKDFTQQFRIILDSIPDNTNIQTKEQFNEGWKQRIRQLESNDVNTVPLEEYEKLSRRFLQMERELKELKGE